MKKFFILVITVGLTASFILKENEYDYPFDNGEELTYKLNYGWFTVGKGKIQIDDKTLDYDGEDCYKMTILGSTAGFLNVFATVKDEWGAIVKKEDLTPMMTYRNIREGKYQLEEQVYINQDSGKIKVDSYKPRKNKRRPTKYFDYNKTDKIYDMLSGLMLMRNHDFEHMEPNDTIGLQAFFEKKFYDFKVIYGGKEMLKTKLGKVKAIKVIPIMPESSIFPGEFPIKGWISDDVNRLPLKIEANMWIGKASCELTSFRNVKNAIDFN